MKVSKGKVKGYAVVRDRYGRIVLNDQIFYDKDALERIRQEVIKNGRNSSDSIST